MSDDDEAGASGGAGATNAPPREARTVKEKENVYDVS